MVLGQLKRENIHKISDKLVSPYDVRQEGLIGATVPSGKYLLRGRETPYRRM